MCQSHIVLVPGEIRTGYSTNLCPKNSNPFLNLGIAGGEKMNTIIPVQSVIPKLGFK